MVNFYVDKIKSRVVNVNTQKEWCLEDVPHLWRAKVEKALQQ